MLIFDEADRMFVDHSSFSAQLSEIQSILPKQRKTALFSATLTSEMTSLIKSGMRNPVFIKVSFNSSDETPSSTTTHALPTTLQTFYVHVPRQYKFALLFQFLLSPLCRRDTPTKCIVFCATCGSVNFIYKCFARLKPFFPYIHAERLYGKMNQKLRIQTYKRFISSEHSCSVLFATDLAARGLDFPCVHWILQFDAPTVIKLYALPVYMHAYHTFRICKNVIGLNVLEPLYVCASDWTYSTSRTSRKLFVICNISRAG